MRKVHIVTDGAPSGTHVTDVETGEEIRGIKWMQWTLEVHGAGSTAVLGFGLHEETVHVERLPVSV